jgi:hypothetical protein
MSKNGHVSITGPVILSHIYAILFPPNSTALADPVPPSFPHVALSSARSNHLPALAPYFSCDAHST